VTLNARILQYQEGNRFDIKQYKDKTDG